MDETNFPMSPSEPEQHFEAPIHTDFRDNNDKQRSSTEAAQALIEKSMTRSGTILLSVLLIGLSAKCSVPMNSIVLHAGLTGIIASIVFNVLSDYQIALPDHHGSISND